VKTKPGAKTCTLDTRKNQIVLIATERPSTPPAATDGSAAASTPPAANPPGGGQPGGQRRGGRGNAGPALLDILVVGR
jgi:hypothetical protein